MHKSAISVWKAARANVVDLPECFPGMNEAQFANLAFDQHCHVRKYTISSRSMSFMSSLGLSCPQYPLRGLGIPGAPLPEMHEDEVSK
jgi:hypothetical protein